MCGITGIISEHPGKWNAVQEMISCLSHRGPDGSSVWENKNTTVTLGHRRLSIIDLTETGNQPMHYLDRYTIVHNGEIYNYKELREQLSAKGYRFRSQSDTEVILAAYDYWKEACLQNFDGMFAFAIWDEQDQRLFAARDRFGEKPFYYTHNNESFSFASEIKALRQPGAKNPNGNLLLQYLANGFVQDALDAGATFDTNIKKLPARHFLKYSIANNALTVIPYFDLDTSYANVPAEEAVTRFRELFFSSVEKRLRSDVEIGTSLSGGLDSSSIIAAIHHLKQTGVVQKAFTASFPGFEKDETSFATTVARQFGLQQIMITPSAIDLVTDLEKFLSQHDEPVSSSSVYAQYKVYESAKKHGVTVLLDGQGADEILAGYSKYTQWYLQELYATNRNEFRKESRSFNTAFGFKNKLAFLFPSWAAIELEKKSRKQQKQLPFVTKDYINEHFSKQSIYRPAVKTLNDILYFDVFGGNLEELLRNSDRNAMAHGVEVRLPFLNQQLVQFIFSLPSTLKIHDGYSKYILRQAMDGMLPKEITWRKDKVGFEPPQQQWMQDPHLQEKIHEAKKKLVVEKILAPAVLAEAVKPMAAHEASNYDWRFLCAGQLF